MIEGEKIDYCPSCGEINLVEHALEFHESDLSGEFEITTRRVVELTYLDLQTREDTIEGHAIRRYWKGHYFRELSDAAIEAVLAHDPSTAASLQAYGGAIAEVPDDATAFSHRATAFEYVGAARWTDPAEDDARIATARESAAALEPFASGAYVNVLGDEGAAGVRRAYSPAKLARLTALKDAVDPENLFHLNQNIPPSRQGSGA